MAGWLANLGAGKPPLCPSPFPPSPCTCPPLLAFLPLLLFYSCPLPSLLPWGHHPLSWGHNLHFPILRATSTRISFLFQASGEKFAHTLLFSLQNNSERQVSHQCFPEEGSMNREPHDMALLGSHVWKLGIHRCERGSGKI